MVSTVWVVYAPPEVRIRRMMEERNLSETEAAKRIASQWDDAAYQAQADRLLDGSGDVTALFEQCDRLIKEME